MNTNKNKISLSRRHGWGTLAVLALLLLLLVSSCSDFTDIKPKGKNLLNSTNDLELLLNNEMETKITDFYEVGSDVIYS